MLNLIELNSKKSISSISDKGHVTSLNKKHFPSSVREWNNSIYVYNKDALDLIPSTTDSVLKIIKSYFSLFNKNMERKIRMKRLLLRLRRLTSNKIFSSKGVFKHTNNKVIISFNIFNRQKYNFIRIMKNSYNRVINKKSFIKGLKSMSSGISTLKRFIKHKYILTTILKNKKGSKINLTTLSQYTNDFYKRFKRRNLKMLRLNYYYRQLLYINNSKLNYTYLQYLKKHLENVYNKNVEFNLINLKQFYLNSDILSESIALKVTKNRKKLVKLLNKIENKIKTRKQLLHLNKPSFIKRELDTTTDLANDKTFLGEFVANNLKYKHVSGFRVETKGRLTRRFTASRSLSKIKYKGNLLGIDSSFRGLSSVLLRGDLRSNLQFTKLNSKSRIGSFGVKGWVSSN